MRRHICAHAGPPTHDRWRTCALSLGVGGRCRVLVECAVCERHAARPPAPPRPGRVPLRVVPCAHEGLLVERCHTCPATAEGRHVRECDLHDVKCTRGVVSAKVRSCATCGDYRPDTGGVSPSPSPASGA